MFIEILKYKKGHTLLEMVISIIVFSLVMITITALLNIGLKTWQIGETSTDSQNSAQVVLHRLTSELKIASRASCIFGYDPDTGSNYIAFDSAMDRDGRFRINETTRTPEWINYIIYYTYKEPGKKFKILYRKEKEHILSPVSKKPSIGYASDFPLDDDPSGNLKIMAQNVEIFEITERGDIINIHLICTRNIGDKKLPYEQDFDPENIKASIDILTSIYPRN